MEKRKSLENAREKIEKAIENLASREGMTPEEIDSDIITFAPVEENNEFMNPEYFEELSERLGISSKEITTYAKTRWVEQNSEE